MNSRIRTRRQYVPLAERSQERFEREEGLAIPPRSRRSKSSLKVKTPMDAQLLSHNGMPLHAESPDVASPAYNLAIQDSRMSFALFVESKFIPEHVEHKTLSGRTHYQAMLKHLLRPETVSLIFNSQVTRSPRMQFVPGWPYLDKVRLCDITSEHVRLLLASASDHGYSPQTIKHIKNVFFAIISHAQREGCFTGPNPAGQVKLPRVSRKDQPNLTISQASAILKLMQYPDQEIALFCLTTDMTIVEICDLQWKHVNLGNSEMYSDGEFIPPLCIAVRRISNHSGIADYRHSRNRNIDIPRPFVQHLRELRRQGEMKGENDFVLTTEGGAPIPPESIGIERLLAIRKAVGLPWLSWQVLRRARVSLLEELRTQLAAQMMGDFQTYNVARAKNGGSRRVA